MTTPLLFLASLLCVALCVTAPPPPLLVVSDVPDDVSGVFPSTLPPPLRPSFDLVTVTITRTTVTASFSSPVGPLGTGRFNGTALRRWEVGLVTRPAGSWRVAQQTSNAQGAGWGGWPTGTTTGMGGPTGTGTGTGTPTGTGTGTPSGIGGNTRLDTRFSWGMVVVVAGGRASVWTPGCGGGGCEARVNVTEVGAREVTVDLSAFPVEERPVAVTAVVGAVYADGDGSFVEFRREATPEFFGGGEDPVDGVRYDPNLLDTLNLPIATSPSRGQENILAAYCAPAGTLAYITPISGPESAASARPIPDGAREPGGSMCVTSKAWTAWDPAKGSRYVMASLPATAGRVTSFSLSLKGGPAVAPSLGADLPALRVEVIEQAAANDRRGAGTLRVRITDPAATRWEVPKEVRYGGLGAPYGGGASAFKVEAPAALGDEFYLVVTRVSDGRVLLDTRAGPGTGRGLLFRDMYLELTTALDPEDSLYGLGERIDTFLLDRSQPGGSLLSMLDIDHGTPMLANLYGSHPFHLALSGPNGTAHGAFMLTSNPLDVALTPTSLTYRLTGGMIDLWLFSGPAVEDVVGAYHETIGRPALPPYWSLGFHQCRWGYHDVQDLEYVVANYSAHGLPLDTQWSDIDYMDRYKLFTLDPVNFPQGQLGPFVERLHNDSQQYVVIIDPGVRIEAGYGPYDQGLRDGLFVSNPLRANAPVVGKVWPGPVHFVDWSHPNASSYWSSNVAEFHSRVAIDGLWTDMNEVSSFCDGCCDMDPANPLEWLPDNLFSCSCNQSSVTPLDFPPYWVGIDNLPSTTTISFNSVNYGGKTLHDMHNLYGHMEAQRSFAAMTDARGGQRPLVITRSTFPGTGAIVGHWLGDNDSTFQSMRFSVPGVLNMQLFGIPLVGADICGFAGNTTPELCSRWMQLGAFYPFSRNHNNFGQISQEPYALGPEVLRASKWALSWRYRLIPYLYTNFVEAAIHGGLVVHPLPLAFPADRNARGIDRQFLLGRGLLVVPALDQGVQEVSFYLPGGRWAALDPATAKGALYLDGGKNVTVAYPYPGGNIPLYVGERHVIPVLTGSFTRSKQTKDQDASFDLFVALPSSSESAVGSLALDDIGDQSYKTPEGAYTGAYMTYQANCSSAGKAAAAPSCSMTARLSQIWNPYNESWTFSASNGQEYDKRTTRASIASVSFHNVQAAATYCSPGSSFTLIRGAASQLKLSATCDAARMTVIVQLPPSSSSKVKATEPWLLRWEAGNGKAKTSTTVILAITLGLAAAFVLAFFAISHLTKKSTGPSSRAESAPLLQSNI
jgi:alpha-glucosidase (family GH31 glycosyl hydrolase)